MWANLIIYSKWFDWLWPINDIKDHLCAVICHSVTQTLMLCADKTGNTYESEQLITNFTSIVLFCLFFFYGRLFHNLCPFMFIYTGLFYL